MVDTEKHPEGYVLEGSTPVAQEQVEKEEAEGENGDSAKASGAAGPAAAGTAGVMVVDGGVIDLMDDDEELAPKVGGKRKLSDGAGPSSSKAQKVDEDIIVLSD